MSFQPMPNRLADETSPYLLQHASNPVDWYPWGEEAWSRAAAEDRPVLLSVGYASCHWCHVMERETFAEDGEATTNTHEAGQRLSAAWKKTLQREGKMVKEGSSLGDLMSAQQEQTGVKGGNQE